jgi:hypothetical protein
MRLYVFESLQVEGIGFFPMFAGMAIQLMACWIDYSLSVPKFQSYLWVDFQNLSP